MPFSKLKDAQTRYPNLFKDSRLKAVDDNDVSQNYIAVTEPNQNFAIGSNRYGLSFVGFRLAQDYVLVDCFYRTKISNSKEIEIVLTNELGKFEVAKKSDAYTVITLCMQNDIQVLISVGNQLELNVPAENLSINRGFASVRDSEKLDKPTKSKKEAVAA